MSLTDDLSMSEWQRRRNAALFGAVEDKKVVQPLSDDMAAQDWQTARAQQLGGSAQPSGVGGEPLTPSQPKVAAKPTYGVDWQFIAEREGSNPNMYVPRDEKGHSGPTIANGIDLGQRNSSDLKSLNLKPDLSSRLSPYLGKQGADAEAFVKTNPLALSGQDLAELTGALRSKELDKLATKFNADSKIGSFDQLPKDTQTAIASLYYQYGTDAPARAAPKFWGQITSGDWESAHSNLLDFGDAYPSRRKLEAERLQNDIQSGKLRRGD